MINIGYIILYIMTRENKGIPNNRLYTIAISIQRILNRHIMLKHQTFHPLYFILSIRIFPV